MSYQVLARKWRPQNFAQLVGQDHVKAALTNALKQNRLHHAYLFTGTRGVGKTTIARIFAKSLNCDRGVTATPCGVCSACVEIDKGYFVDLLEIDAASRTKVEDTRDLLDNVQYAPSKGRYKVYLIDEVHMLSKHSFNALLKTLEEPPPHVKFLLATTDPQKLPITVLSRCLQFSLKALTQQQIKQHLQFILQQEQIGAEEDALALLARAAKGSLRDSLSLTDQAIAQTNGQISLGPVREMLGYLEQSWAELLLQDVFNRDLTSLQQHLAQLISQHSQYQAVLDDMLSLLHLAALSQFQLTAAELALTESAFVRAVAKSQPAESIQLYYQLLLSGKKDLPFAPDPRIGLEMALLRAIAFVPAPEHGEQSLPSSRAVALTAAGLPDPTQVVKTEPAAVAEVQDAPDALAVAPETAPVNVDSPQIDPLTASIMARRGMALSPATVGGLAEKKSERLLAPVENLTSHPNQQVAEAEPPLTQTVASAEKQQSVACASAVQGSDNQKLERQELDEEDIGSSGSVTRFAEFIAAEDEDDDPVVETASSDWAWQQYQPAEPPKAEQSTAQPAPIRNALLDSLVVASDNTDFTKESTLQLAPTEQPVQSLTFTGTINAENFAVRLASQVDEWAARIDQLAIGGLMRLFLLHSSLQLQDGQVRLQVSASQRHLDNPKNRDALQQVLSASFAQPLALVIEFVDEVLQSPVALQQRIEQARTDYVRALMASDPIVQQLQRDFAAELLADTLTVH